MRKGYWGYVTERKRNLGCSIRLRGKISSWRVVLYCVRKIGWGIAGTSILFNQISPSLKKMKKEEKEEGEREQGKKD